jgi:hypothetical protein
MAMAHWASHVVYVAAKLGLADYPAKEPMNANQLSELTETHPPSLYRLMRTLASFGIMSEDESHRFSLTPVGEGNENRCTRRGASHDPNGCEPLVV